MYCLLIQIVFAVNIYAASADDKDDYTAPRVYPISGLRGSFTAEEGLNAAIDLVHTISTNYSLEEEKLVNYRQEFHDICARLGLPSKEHFKVSSTSLACHTLKEFISHQHEILKHALKHMTTN